MATFAEDSPEMLAAEQNFHELLRSTSQDAFGVEANIVDAYWEKLRKLPVDVRELALHDSPIDLVSALTGLPITPEVEVKFNVLVDPVQVEEATSDLVPAIVVTRAAGKAVNSALRMLGYEATYESPSVEFLRYAHEKRLSRKPVNMIVVVSHSKEGVSITNAGTLVVDLTYKLFGTLDEEALQLIAGTLRRAFEKYPIEGL